MTSPQAASLQDALVGQRRVIARVKRLFENAYARSDGTLPPNLLIVGPPGCGKTSLARALEHGVPRVGRWFYLQATKAMTPQELRRFLVSLDYGDLVFLDEVHLLRAPTAQLLLGALEGYRIPHPGGIDDLGEFRPAGMTSLATFTLIAATSSPASIPSASDLIQRLSPVLEMEPYSTEDLAEIVKAVGLRRFGLELTTTAARRLSSVADDTPRLAINHLRHLALTVPAGRVEDEAVCAYLTELGVDADTGLGASEQRLILALHDRQNRAVNVATLAVLLRIRVRALQDDLTPRLIARDLLEMKPGRGRILTPKGLALAARLAAQREAGC